MGVEEYLGGGTATTMAIVASAVMSDHQKFITVMATLKVAQDATHTIVAININSQDIDWMAHFN
jgi:predicted Rossmann-fold nucleotide-binding protein